MSNRKLPERDGFPYTRDEFVIWLRLQDQDHRFEYRSSQHCMIAEAIRQWTRRSWTGKKPEVWVGTDSFLIDVIESKRQPLPDWLPWGCSGPHAGRLAGIEPFTPRRVLEVMGEKPEPTALQRLKQFVLA